MKNLLTIENLSVDFINDESAGSALQDISLSVNKGEIVALVGESGSGKSVTALSILQLLPSPPAKYKSGKIFFGDEEKELELLHLSQKEMEQVRGNKIAMIFQEPMTSLNPVKVCGAQVSEALVLHKKINNDEAKIKTIALFEQVQLPKPAEIFYRYPFQLSGGQKQRVMIAMAMSCSPQLLICDEPTTALDVTVQKNILQLIQSLQQQTNMGVIFITHDLGIVSEIADRIMVMYKGKIVEEGITDEILVHPKHPYTKALLACRPSQHKKGERLPVVSDFINEESLEQSGFSNEQQSFLSTKPTTFNCQLSTILSVQNLNIWFPSKKTFTGKILEYTKAVNNVSFEVYKGETLGLVGESGCGKTTLGRALPGLIQPTNGNIFFNGSDISKLSNAEKKSLRKEMQIVFQDPYSSLNPRKKIGDAIAEPLLVHKLFATAKQRKEKVIELMEKVNLSPEYYNRYPHEFSGGQRQRIVIARALALEPSFVICDESVSALDVSVQSQILNLLNDLKYTFNFTCIFISHDLSVIRYISDRIMVMNKGRIEETGDAEEIYNHPKTAYTKRLIYSIPKAVIGNIE